MTVTLPTQPTMSAARRAAEATLGDTGTVTRAGADTYDDTTYTFTTATPTTVWAGVCSLGPAGATDRTDSAGDDRLIATRIARIPAVSKRGNTTSGDVDDIAVGDLLTVDGNTYTVRSVQHRTTEVLRRLAVVSLADSEDVPI